MVGLIELNVVDGPFSWRTIKRTPTLVLWPLRSFVSCGGIVSKLDYSRLKPELYHRNLGGMGGGTSWVLPSGWDGLDSLAMLPLFTAPAHERLYDGNRDEDGPCGMGLLQAEPHVEEPCLGTDRIDDIDQLR